MEPRRRGHSIDRILDVGISQMGTRPLQVHYAWGGSLPSELANSVHVMKMCEAMAQLGHTVTLHHSSPGSERWSGADSEGVFAAYGIRTNGAYLGL